jgi:serine/threonine-protein kinase RsbW
MGVISRSVSLRIASRLDCVGPLGDQVRAACAELGLSGAAAGEVELSVVETVNNAIEHAYQMAESGWVEVSLASDGQRLRIEISDGGRAMRPEVLAGAKMPAVDPGDIASLPEGGMGLALVKQLMDDVRYQRADGRNVLTMERRIDREGVQPG